MTVSCIYYIDVYHLSRIRSWKKSCIVITVSWTICQVLKKVGKIVYYRFRTQHLLGYIYRTKRANKQGTHTFMYILCIDVYYICQV